MVTFNDLQNKISEFKSRVGRFSIGKSDFFGFMTDMVNKQKELADRQAADLIGSVDLSGAPAVYPSVELGWWKIKTNVAAVNGGDLNGVEVKAGGQLVCDGAVFSYVEDPDLVEVQDGLNKNTLDNLDVSSDLAETQRILSEQTRFNQNDLVKAYRITSTGAAISASTSRSTDYISLNGVSEIEVTLIVTTADAGLSFYDSNKQFISSVMRSGSKGYSLEKIVVPGGAEFVRTTFWNEANLVDGVGFMLKLLGKISTGNKLDEVSLRTRFRLFSSYDGYASYSINPNEVRFSSLYLLDSETGKRVFLNDGVNGYSNDCKLSISLYDAVYFKVHDFEQAAENTEITLQTKIWTNLADGEISLGIVMSLGDSTKHYGELFSVVDKKNLYDNVSSINSRTSALEDGNVFDNILPSNSLLDENTIIENDSAGIWEIRYPNANNYIQKLTDDGTYFKVSLNTDGGGNPAIWSINDIDTIRRDQQLYLNMWIKGETLESIKINTDGSIYDVNFTTEWQRISIPVVFGSTYGDMRLMLYNSTSVVFYLKDFELLTTTKAEVQALKKSDKVIHNILNTEYLPSTISKFGDILFDNSGVLNIGLFGDSWTHGVGSVSTGLISYAKYIARIMWDKYGYAGLGWYDFGYSNSTWMKCADDEAVTYNNGGTGSLTYIAKTSNALGIPIAHTVMDAGKYHELVFDGGRGVDNAKIWFYNDAHFEYQIDGGAAVEVTADSVSGWQSVEINQAIASLRITARSNNTIVFGVDLSYGATGVKIHKLGCRGLTTAQAIAVDEVNWKQGLQVLDLDFFSVMLFTNDRSGSVKPSVVVDRITELLSRVKEVYPYSDVAILCPSDTPGGSGTYAVSEYTDALRSYAINNNFPFLALLPVFGSPAQINALGTFYDYLHPSKRGGYLISEYLFKHLFEYHQYS